MPKHLTVNDEDLFVPVTDVNQPNGVAGLDATGKLPVALLPGTEESGVDSVNGMVGDVTLGAADVGAVPAASVGANNGVAPLDGTGKLPVAKLPSVAVQSVNGYAGPSVTLAASDVNALPVNGYTSMTGRYSHTGDGTNNSFEWKNPGGTIATRIGANGNLVMQGTAYSVAGVQFGSTTASFGGGAGGVIGITNATTLPTTNPSGGAVLYSDAGVLKVRQSDGTVVTIANAGAGAVSSVNGQTGAVTLTAADVGAIATTARGAASGVASLDGSTLVPVAQIPSLPASQITTGTFSSGLIPDLSATYLAVTRLGAASGVASLDGTTTIPVAQIPNLSGLPTAKRTITASASSDIVFAAIVSGDAFDRWRLTADGGLAAGPGTVTRDTTMTRTAAGEWTMNGKLVLGADPTANLGAATKQYADNNFVSSSAKLDNVFAPGDQGFIAWTADPAAASDTGQPASGGIRMAKIILRRAATITNIWVTVTVAGATLTSGQNLLGLYTSAGTRVGVTADQTTAWGTTGNKSAALTSAYSAAAGTYYVAILSVGTTIPTFIATSAPSISPVNANATVSTGRFLSGPSSQTSMPASITMGSNTLNYTAYWAAVN